MKNYLIERTSRRGLMQATLTVIGIGIVHSATAQDADKLAQSIVQYQPSPKDGAKCSGCVNYVEPNACKIVVGPINPEGWCVAYAPKGG